MTPGVGGRLVSGDALDRLDRWFAGRCGEGDRARAEGRLAAWWRGASRALGPASGARAVASIVVQLTRFLGFDHRPGPPVADGISLALLPPAGAPLALLVLPWGGNCHRAWRPAVGAAIAVGARWCVVANGPAIHLLDAGRTFSRRALEFDLAMAACDPRAFAALWTLLRADAFTAAQGDESLIAAVVARSDAHGVSVRGGLRDGVLRALEELTGGLAAAAPRGRRAPAIEALYGEALTAVYRLLFLLFAESRDLVPVWHRVYRDGYALSALQHALERGAPRAGTWEALQAIARLAHAGCRAGDLVVPPFNGRLFSPSRAPSLDRLRVDDGCAARALAAVTTMEAPGGARERIAYRDLDVEQLGAVYETVLEYEPSAARKVALNRTAVARRKATGTFYTPRALTDHLVAATLAPLVEGRRAAEVLALRVVDPAMGSGAFLVAACRYLAAAYEAALVRDGEAVEGDIGDRDRAGFRRLVVQQCLYGVDLNPTAVQLARLSLWLATLAGDRPLSFLDHRLVAGDSLVGAAPADLARPAAGGRRRGDAPTLFDDEGAAIALAAALPARWRLERDPDDSIDAVRRKEAAVAALAADAAVGAWKTACDVWCGAWFDTRPPAHGELRALLDHVLGRSWLPAKEAEPRVAALAGHARARRALHWSLEFPEVFLDATGRPREGGGFDAVLGNPPWEMLRADGPGVDRDVGRMVRFLRDAGLYRAQSRGHANLYQLFVERGLSLLRPGGRLGLVLPSGLASDAGAASLRQWLLRRSALDAIVGFENRDRIFPIHRSVRFVLLTATAGGPTARVRCRFGERDPNALAESMPEDDERTIVLTPAQIERLSGPDAAIPHLLSRRDLVLLERLTDAHPPLAGAAGWGARFGRELNATEDRDAFVSSGGLPVLDGRHVQPFRADPSGASRFLPRAEAARRLDPAATFDRARLAYRDVAGATNRLTLIAALIPPGAVTTHTLFCLRTRFGVRDQLVLCALLNSFVANWLVRLRVTTHVTVGIVERLAVPRPLAGSASYVRLARLAARLHRGAPLDGDAYAELQACAAAVYGLTVDELSHVLDTFPLVDGALRARVLSDFES